VKNLRILVVSLFLSFELLAFEEFLVGDIRIIGLQRVSTGSIYNVIPINVGDKIDIRKASDISRSLFKTEQFDDIEIGNHDDEFVTIIIYYLYICI